jgi:beta-phosphoglucomutase-like phosphatase (HAD superfamily)
VHLKDVDAELAGRVRDGRIAYTDAVREGIYRPLGRGDIDVPGIVGALEALGARVPLAIATSASREDIAPTMARYELGRHFQAVVTVEDVARAKPDPEIYLLAAKKIGIEPRACVAFEDSPTGARAARAAGMRVIGMTTTLPAGGIGDVVHSIADYTALEALLAIIGLS